MPQHPSDSLARLYARPGFLLRRAHQISAALFENECSHIGLTPAQFGVLTVLRAHTGVDQSSLARALGFDKVTVLRVLRGLESRGLVARSPAPANRKNLSVVLTDAGKSLLNEAQTPADLACRKLLGSLDALQQTQFIELLQRFTQGLEDQARAAFVPFAPPEQIKDAAQAAKIKKGAASRLKDC